MSMASPLVAICLGYMVYLMASKEKEDIRMLGRVIGIFVMMFALVAFTVDLSKGTEMRCGPKMGKGACPMMGMQGQL